jgi:hypothetical protein
MLIIATKEVLVKKKASPSDLVDGQCVSVAELGQKTWRH